MNGPELQEAKFTVDKMNDGLLSLGERFLQSNLTPVFFKCETSNVYYIVKFEKANYGFH